MRVPKGQLCEQRAIGAGTHNLFPHIVAGVDSNFFERSCRFGSLHQLLCELAIGSKILAPPTVGTWISFHVDPNWTVMGISQLFHHVVDLTFRCFVLAETREHVDSDLILGEPGSQTVVDSLEDIGIEGPEWSPGACNDKGPAILPKAFESFDRWSGADIES